MEINPSWAPASSASSQAFPNILCHRKVHYCVHKSPPLIAVGASLVTTARHLLEFRRRLPPAIEDSLERIKQAATGSQKVVVLQLRDWQWDVEVA
jgi:glutamate/tyrosine decarboxylase-like PLP-dependent enzyme